MKTSEKIWWWIAGIIVVILNYYMISDYIDIQKSKRVYCGEIVIKSSELTNIKHGTRTDLYFMIQFPELGLRRVNPNDTDYFSREVGQKVCYEYSKTEVDQSTGDGLRIILRSITGAIDIVFGVFIIGCCLFWINKLFKRFDK